MKIKYLLVLLALGYVCNAFGQLNNVTSALYDSYEKYQESTLAERRIKHSELQPLIAKLKAVDEFTVAKVGESIEGRSISLISIGTGETDVFLWSQMHGNEPTATQAIFDIFNFLQSDDFVAEKKEMLAALTLHFLPMLNPDGAENFQRRNTLGIDINRDALQLQSPESRILKRVRDSLQADFGFNLHDQSTYYNAERTEKPATISYLAPAFNYEKDINTVRANAMKVIVYMNSIIQNYAPGQVGRYNDDFEPRAFGDNIQKWGTSAILIESGGYPNDIEKQEIRKLNYVSILSALATIANKSYMNIPVADYEKIPENDRKLFDLKIEGVTYHLLGKDYRLDIGINRVENDFPGNKDFYVAGQIADQGDLSTYYGYETFDANTYRLKEGKLVPEIIKSIDVLSKMDILQLLKSGYTHVRVENVPNNIKHVTLPIHVVSANYKRRNLKLQPGANATFLLEKEGEIRYAVMNGYLIDLTTGTSDFKNALMLK
ncbi:M14 metallopeptidase family protein [Arenibacter sp. GZD96]|uniref:M14 family metallopeptidase n=1 Tax=Aurantibrevibacter litoralis TaxID=3106030 RepID=UPI002B0006A8|nr:M14 metallopeptidase family protein [Arenibacter sp. GZD-96]MEA1785336.1 M14 metallopeptidase family protein [Arenibacter sp. GZD-96]